ncbi:tripartite tricarboxylate transporter TctB family protein [Chelatococcus sp. GCM10030263]|uniref:tripartite tricarboxylate transporter TctB family protein n=1 Tax=Chelatococcus sp. GCM10030263 TaxID=3273387 RepID=UPI00360DCB3A
MPLKLADEIFAALLLVVGLVVLVMSWNYGLMSEGTPGTGFFPFFAGLVITGGSGATLARSLRGRAALEGRIGRNEVLINAGLVVAFIVFLFAVPVLGFTPAALLMTLAVGWISRDQRGLAFAAKLLATTVLVVAGCHVLFGTVLGAPLPTGFFGF